MYEDGILIKATESEVEVDENEYVTSKVLLRTVRYTYDGEGKVLKKTLIFPDGTQRIYQNEYHKDERANTSVTLPTGAISNSGKDHFGRKDFDELVLGKGFCYRKFDYLDGTIPDASVDGGTLRSAPTTSLISRLTFSDGRTIDYTYDEMSRITKVEDSVDGVSEYTYDCQGQLLTETKDGVTVNTMTYDGYGNILSKNGKIYTYGDPVWKDKLTAYDGNAITYDAQGNPLSYLGYSLTWEKGRQLKSAVGNGKNIAYTYNENGFRTSKTVDGVTHSYLLSGKKILREKYGETVIDYLYDNEDSVCGLIYNETPYYFKKNLQGDVIQIVNEIGLPVANYSYDAWGVCTVTSDNTATDDFVGIAAINPIRYRSYYYDVETGLYYVSTRYYNPTVGRFINADETTYLGASETILGYNLFTYCENNPVNYDDPAGNWLIQVVCGVAGAAVFGTVANIMCRILGVNATIRRLITAGFALIGGVLGVAFGPALVGKIAPKALAWVNNLEKIINSKSRLRPMLYEGHVAIGWEWDRRFKIMLHFKHNNEPEKGMHITIQHFTGRNWRKSIPDIPIKSLGSMFINWVKNFLK